MLMFVRSLLAGAMLVAGIGSTVAAAAEWPETVLFNFVTDGTGSENGYNPRLGVLLDGADMYGVTVNGGANGGGTVYRLSGSTMTPLYSFTTDDATGCGYAPSSHLLRLPTGELFGTTIFGGVGGGGVLFKLVAKSDPSQPWTCKAIYSFVNKGSGIQKGYAPFGGLISGADGTLYGTTQSGGVHGGGVVFKLKGINYKVIHQFSKTGDDAKNGYGPTGALTLNSSTGVLYGTTFFGGPGKGGVVYKLTPAGNGTFTYEVVHKFLNTTGANGARKGYQPTQGPLLLDNAGNLYGATLAGGCSTADTIQPPCEHPVASPVGVIYKIGPGGAYSVLYTFDNSDNGQATGYTPYGGLIMDSNGALIGVTQLGGVNGAGTVFRLLKNGTRVTLFSFGGSNNETGYQPSSGLVRDGSGNLYGTTFYGGADSGILFKLSKP